MPYALVSCTALLKAAAGVEPHSDDHDWTLVGVKRQG